MRGWKLSRRVTVALVGAMSLVMSVGVTAWAAHTFTDVPDDHLFHGEIAWMKDNDITRGCNPPANTRYCPEDTTTRGEMAAFFYRFARSRAVDAGWLEGHTADEFLLKSEFDPDQYATKTELNNYVLESEIHENALKPLAERVRRVEGTQGSGLVVAGNTYTVYCAPGEVALAGGYDGDFGIVDDAVDGLLGPLGVALGLVGLGDLVDLGETLDGVSNVNVHGSMPVYDDGDDLWGWQVQTTLNVASDITVYALCGA